MTMAMVKNPNCWEAGQLAIYWRGGVEFGATEDKFIYWTCVRLSSAAEPNRTQSNGFSSVQFDLFD